MANHERGDAGRSGGPMQKKSPRVAQSARQ
nr:MAG TPA: hypothetical protein [Caudoviricetes sp.]